MFPERICGKNPRADLRRCKGFNGMSYGFSDRVGLRATTWERPDGALAHSQTNTKQGEAVKPVGYGCGRG
jgi:hypothetical protein